MKSLERCEEDKERCEEDKERCKEKKKLLDEFDINPPITGTPIVFTLTFIFTFIAIRLSYMRIVRQ